MVPRLTNSSKKALFAQFCTYVPLNVAGMSTIACLIIANTFFISKGVGDLGLAAYGLVSPIYSLISALGLFIGVGGSTKFMMHCGKNQQEQAQKTFSMSISIVIILGIILVTLGIFGAEWLARQLGADSETLPYAADYLRLILLGGVLFLFKNTLLPYVRNDGNPKLSVIGLVVSCLGAILIDYILVIKLELGIIGAAIAMLSMGLIATLTLSLQLFKKGTNLVIRRFRFTFKEFILTIKNGSSAFITEFAPGIVALVFNFTIYKISGNLGLSAYTIIANINMFIALIFSGIAEGSQPLISRFYSEDKVLELNTVKKWILAFAGSIGLIVYGVLVIFAPSIVNIFNNSGDANLAVIAITGIKLYFIGSFFAGINISLGSICAAKGKSLMSIFLALLRSVIILIPAVSILSSFMDLNGVWLAMPVAEILTLSITLLLRKNI